jgi:membrane protein DedA with SNARE-associated domain
VKKLQRVLRRGGWKVVVLGRLAVFPSTVMGVAAGSSGMNRRTFVLADAAGALASMVIVIGSGYLLGEAYQSAGRWLTIVGALVLVGLAVMLGRYLKRLS